MNRCLMTETVLIKRKTSSSQDNYGQPVEAWATNETTIGRLENLSVRETLGGSAEQLENINIAMATHVVYLPPDASVTEEDRLEIDSTTYEIKQVIKGQGVTLNHYEVRVVELR